MTGKKIKAAFSLLIVILFTFSTYNSVFAKDPEFRLDIDSLNLQMGASTNLALSLINARGAKITEIKGLKENFDVMNSTQSKSTQAINGDISYQNDIQYVIMPKKEGQFTLQGNIEYNGKTYQTNELTINVTKSANTQQAAISDLFIKTNISNTNIYLGQKVVLTYELYSKYNVEGFQFSDNIEVNGFLMNDVTQDKFNAEFVYLEGNKYYKFDVRQIYLTPIKDGTFSLPEYNFQVNVTTDGGGFFGFSQTESKFLKTESKQLTVKPLPGNKPSDFSGLVGKLSLKSEYSRQEVAFGDSITLKVIASGSCDLSVLDKITKNGIPGFNVYETSKDIHESIIDNQYTSRKEYEIILVPEKGGEVKIDPINISYFDTESGTYKQAEIAGTTITVKGEAPQVQTQAQAQNSGTAVTQKVVIDQVNYGTKNEGYLTIQLKKDYIFIILILLIIIAVLIASAFIMLKYLRKQDRELEGIYKQLKSVNDKNEIYSILNNMIKYRFNLSLKASSKDLIKSRLAQYELDSPILEVMDYLENDKNPSEKGETYLKEKIREIYKALVKIKSIPYSGTSSSEL